jgi:hypothetical protein
MHCLFVAFFLIKSYGVFFADETRNELKKKEVKTR